MQTGSITLVGGRMTVANSAVTAYTKILLTKQDLRSVTTPGRVSVQNIVPGVSFDIASDSPSDTANVIWKIQ